MELAPPGVVAAALSPYGQGVKVEAGYINNEDGSASPVFVHGKEDCRLVNGHCVFHAPSDHPLAGAPMVMRLDKHALIERLCEHGVGHPDPDSLAYLVALSKNCQELGIHGCDGCCG